LAAVLSVGVVATIFVSRRVEASRRVPVYGAIDRAEYPFFLDARVRAVFARHGLDLHVGQAGSDFAATDSGESPTRLSTPLALVAPTSALASLERAGVVRNRSFDLSRYMTLVRRGESLPRIASPSITSTTGALFAAAAGTAANGTRLLTTIADVDRVVNSVSPLFQATAGGLHVGTQAELLASHGPNTTVLSLAPTISAVQSLTAKTARGGSVVQLLASDETLRTLAAQHGFEVGGTAVSTAILDALTTRVAASLRASA
jgi:hypothetical protein